MIEGLVKLTKASISRVATGGKLITSTAVKEQRLALCRECPSKDSLTCKECGCFIAAKVSAAASYCPLGKWKSEDVV